MNGDFTRNSLRTIALVVALLVVDRLPAITAHASLFRRLDFLSWQMHNGRLNADDFHALAAGYYEGIENTEQIARGPENNDYYIRGDFRRYEYKPHVNHPYPAGMRITNSLGMPNPEYLVEKPAHTRRIALLGDSLAVGPYGQDYDTLLEARLNQTYTTPGIQKFQILNFAVSGYVLLQMMDVALETAPKFHPDVYMVQLTSQEIVGSRKHIARLLTKGVDLKYGFVRKLVADAGVKSSDHMATIILKLAPYFTSLTRQSLEKIRDHASEEGAGMVIVLVPAAIDPGVTASDFDQLHRAADGLGVPVIDLRNTFRGVDLHTVQVVAEADIHPNVQGHRMIFDDLYSHLLAQPQALAALTGSSASAALQSPHSPPH